MFLAKINSTAFSNILKRAKRLYVLAMGLLSFSGLWITTVIENQKFIRQNLILKWL